MLRNSKSMANLKQHDNPSKQGAFYELNLGKNNGPFLSKDIMYNNRKSMNLLSNLHILKSHETMMSTMNNMQQSKQGKLSTMGVEKVENFTGVIEYCVDELRQMSQLSNGMKIQQRALKQQLAQLSSKAQNNITQLYESSMPGIKLFLRRVREMNCMDKQQNYQLRRQLEKMQMQVSLLKKGVVECENKIEHMQSVFSNQKDKTNEEETMRW